MAKKNLLGNIIGQAANQSKTNSDEVNNDLGKGSNPPEENNGGGETPSGPVGKETQKETPIEKEPIKQTPKVQEPPKEKPILQETLVLSNPGNNEGAEYKAGSGSIRIAPVDMSYIDLLVKHKRMSGYTNYTKKEALGEALGLLMDKYPKEKLLSSNQTII